MPSKSRHTRSGSSSILLRHIRSHFTQLRFPVCKLLWRGEPFSGTKTSRASFKLFSFTNKIKSYSKHSLKATEKQTNSSSLTSPFPTMPFLVCFLVKLTILFLWCHLLPSSHREFTSHALLHRWSHALKPQPCLHSHQGSHPLNC